MTDLELALDGLALIDHHVHGPLRQDLTLPEFEAALSESDRAAPPGTSTFDSALGFAVRRWCAPVLDLEPHAAPADYLARRTELGVAEVNQRFLSAAGVGEFLVETGFHGDLVLSPTQMTAACGTPAREVVRLEALAEELAGTGVAAGEFIDRFAGLLARRSATAVGLKTVVAYRHGLDVDPTRPTPREVIAAVGMWLRGIARGEPVRLTDSVLLRHIIWAGVDRGLPLQIHTGFGDPDLRLHRVDPLLLTDFIELLEPTGTPVLLLHCYPFHRNAGYLAHAYPHVYFDVGLAVPYVGAAAADVVAEALELAPFSKILYSSDAWGLAELHHLGALLWRQAMHRVLTRRIDDGDWAAADALRVATMIGRDNARRVYRLT